MNDKDVMLTIMVSLLRDGTVTVNVGAKEKISAHDALITGMLEIAKVGQVKRMVHDEKGVQS